MKSNKRTESFQKKKESEKEIFQTGDFTQSFFLPDAHTHTHTHTQSHTHTIIDVNQKEI